MKFLTSFSQVHCEQLHRLVLAQGCRTRASVDGNSASAQNLSPAPSQGLQPAMKQCLLVIYVLRLDIISYILERL